MLNCRFWASGVGATGRSPLPRQILNHLKRNATVCQGTSKEIHTHQIPLILSLSKDGNFGGSWFDRLTMGSR